MLNITEALKIFGEESISNLNRDNIKSKFRKLMRNNHPDLGGDEEKAKVINIAYTLLKKEIEKGTSNTRGGTENYTHSTTEE